LKQLADLLKSLNNFLSEKIHPDTQEYLEH